MLDRISYIFLLFPLTLQLLYLHQLLPHPTYISIFICLLSTFALLINNTTELNLNILFTGLLFLVYGSLYLFISNQTYHYGFIIISFCILLIVSTKGNIKKIIKFYIILAVIISFIGLISWVLVHSGQIDYNRWGYSLLIETDGKIKKGDIFVNPYGLGLVYRKIWTIFDIPYHRASGLSHEPNIASLFANPAMLYLIYNYRYNKQKNKFNFYCYIIFFIIVCNSLSAYISLTIIFIFFQLYT